MNFYERYRAQWDFLNVSRETFLKLSAFIDLFEERQKRDNLISRRETENIWKRHVLDSAQLLKNVSRETISGTDFGSGGGFPGIILSILDPNIHFKLVEASLKKATFLREVGQSLTLNITVFNDRIEALVPWKETLITARALAPLERLIPLLYPFTNSSTHLILPKGKKVYEELQEFEKNWKAHVKIVKSITSDEGHILCLTDLKPKNKVKKSK